MADGFILYIDLHQLAHFCKMFKAYAMLIFYITETALKPLRFSTKVENKNIEERLPYILACLLRNLGQI